MTQIVSMESMPEIKAISQNQAKRLAAYASCSTASMVDTLVSEAYGPELLAKLKTLRSQLETMALEEPAVIVEFSNKYDWLCNIIKAMTIDLVK